MKQLLAAAGLLLCLSFFSAALAADPGASPKSGGNQETGKTKKDAVDTFPLPDSEMLKIIEKERVKQLKRKGRLRVTQPENPEQDKQFLKRLKEQRRYAIGMQNHDVCEEIQRILAAGIDAFLTECTKRKPSSERLVKWCTKRWNDGLPKWNKALHTKCKP